MGAFFFWNEDDQARIANGTNRDASFEMGQDLYLYSLGKPHSAAKDGAAERLVH